MLLVEYRILDNLKVINEGTEANPKLKIRGKFQKCNEQNRNKRVYPEEVLTNQVKSLQEKIQDRSLVGALDHPTNDEIRLSQASHLITKLWVEKNGDVMGEAEILSTPAGKIAEALIKDGVKIGISSRGVGTVSEGENGSVVNNDFKLITFDLVSDPSTKGAYPELTESAKVNSEKAKNIIKKVKAEQVFLTMLENKISEWKSSKDVSPAVGKQNRANRLNKAAEIAKKNNQPAHAKMYSQGHSTGTVGLGAESAKRISARKLKQKSASNMKEALVAAVTNLIMERNKENKAKKTSWEGGDSPTLKRSKRFERKVSADPSVKSYSAYRNRMETAKKNPQSYSSWNSLKQMKEALKERCWKGYEPVQGKKPYSKGSCKKK